MPRLSYFHVLPMMVLAFLLILMSLPGIPGHFFNSLKANAGPAATFTVNSTGDGADNNLGDGLCNDGSGVCTLRAAIQQANSLAGNDIIGFNLPPSSTITLNTELNAINSNLVINGPGANTLTVERNPADGTPNFRIFTIDPGATVTISDLTITKGSTGPSVNGGGVSNSGSLFLTHVNVTGNKTGAGVGGSSTGGSGGGIYNLGPLTISGSTISNNQTGNGGSGAPGGYGGGIYTQNVLTITDSIVSGNLSGGGGMVVGRGGGIFNTGTLNMINSLVDNNQTTAGQNGEGGGIANVATLTLTSSSVTNNTSGTGAGGGIYGDNGTISLIDSVISGNQAGTTGGGISSLQTVSILRCSITNNTSRSGGGLYVSSSDTSTLINSTISGNRSSEAGGGTRLGGAVTLTNVTITDNRSDSNDNGAETGGGIFREFGVQSLNNTLVARNFRGSSPGTIADDIAGTVDSASSFNLIGTGGSGGLTNGVNNNQVGVADPRLEPLANNGGPTLTHALLVDSPAIDAGNSSLTTDQRGRRRPIDDPTIVNAPGGNASDIGAFEAHSFEVSTTADSGPGSLRQAILDTNANAGADTIAFNIPGTAVHTIIPTSDLPSITDSLVIDGYTQPGSSPNTLPDGNDAVLLVEIKGSSLGGFISHDGIHIDASNCTVRGLVINSFTGNGIGIGTSTTTISGNAIEGNFIGPNSSGTQAPGNNTGVGVFFSNNNVIGGTTPAARNVISGNGTGISVSTGGSHNLIQGNFIGTTASGRAALGNFTNGISSSGSGGDTIGGTASGARNVIAATQNNAGIYVQSGTSTASVIQGNLIGTDVTGTVALGNYFGIWLYYGGSQGNIIGGVVPNARNVVSGNRSHGILISGDSSNNQLQGNLVGTDITGTKPLGNAGEGIQIEAGANGNRIGGNSPGQGNTIAFNRGNGILLTGSPFSVVANFSRSNSIFSNGFLGIDLGGDGVTPNDPGDADFGFNNFQNFPLITSVTTNSTQTTITGTLNSTPNTTFSINFYASNACDPSGNGEGAYPFGSIATTTNASGDASFGMTISLPLPAGQVITATATDAAGNTSEFSPCDATNAKGSVQFSVTSANVIEDVGFFTVNVIRTGGSAGSLTVDYSTADITATAGQDYGATAGTLTFNDGETNKSFNIPISDDAITESDETFIVRLRNVSPVDSLGAANDLIITIQDHGTVPVLSINDIDVRNNIDVSESAGKAILNLSLSAATSQPVSVEFATSDLAGTQACNVFNGRASARCDYLTAIGKLNFAPRSTTQTITVLLVDDSYAEGDEILTVSLTNPVGATINDPTATVTITDIGDNNGPNPIDQAGFFVRQHYLDFLNREPDAAGLAHWTNQITECQQPGATCDAEVRRINVSAAFFLSIEFQETGYLVERIYKSAYGDADGTSTLGGTPHTIKVPIVTFNEFLADTQQIGKDVVVGAVDWQIQLENNKVAFTQDFVVRSRFVTAYPTSITPAEFVDALFLKAGVTPTTDERSSIINEFGGAGTSADTAARARALRRVAEHTALKEQEKSQAFVLMQYFGYLRRDPNAAPDADHTGYDFWLTKLNDFNGNFVNAEMVKAFISSIEYRARFGP